MVVTEIKFTAIPLQMFFTDVMEGANQPALQNREEPLNGVGVHVTARVLKPRMGTRGPIISSLSARYFAGPQVATIYGGIYSANAIGAAAGALTGGALHDLTGGYRAGLVIALVFVTLAALPFWIVRELRNFR